MFHIDDSWKEAAGMGTKPNSIAIRFEIVPEPDPEASEREGRPMFKDVEYIEKRIPGDRNLIHFQPITKDEKKEFQAAYRAWKEGLEDPTSGTSLKEWPLLSRSQVETFVFSGCRTVEQLAEMSDGNCAAMGAGVLSLRSKARDWLARAAGNAQDLKLRSELEKRDAEIAALRDQVAKLVELKTAEQDGEQPKHKLKR